jgi:glycerol-3-phosphate dehydrogenase
MAARSRSRTSLGRIVTQTSALDRQSILANISSIKGECDVVVIGGGATGLGCAVEAAARGYRTVLLEASDFAKATSSRSTKLVHGGVRYLQEGDIKLVLEALRERGRILRNAPHLAHRRAFIIPAYSYWQLPFYGMGLTVYDLLAGRESIGRSKIISPAATIEALPTVDRKNLKGGIVYYDGQFDDARFAIALLRTLFDLGGLALNYASVTTLLKRNGQVGGVGAEDRETGHAFELAAKAVINATGIFTDEIRRLDEPASQPVVTVSQGTHFVLPQSFLPGDTAMMIPRTADGRVLFAIPWHDHLVVGTTDDPVPRPNLEPRAMPEERNFLLAHIEKYLGRRPEPQDVLSMWSGQRPLVRKKGAGSTAALSRDHTIFISPSKLVTVTGGKWTTYRKMSEDTIDRAAPLGALRRVSSRTAELRLHGWTKDLDPAEEWENCYGADLAEIRRLEQQNPGWASPLHAKLPVKQVEVVWAARYEMARCVEDVLARRTRALFLDARAAAEAAGEAAHLLALELGRNVEWERQQTDSFRQLAHQYIWHGESGTEL